MVTDEMVYAKTYQKLHLSSIQFAKPLDCIKAKTLNFRAVG